jgi:NAD(P)-dependent dehydrogenase (short-subunit alcohol dehydrogenase family)
MPESVAALLGGRTVLVTGASSGIGKAIAIAAARAGADVAITYCANEAGVRDTEAQIRALGRRTAVFQADISDDASLHALGPAARDSFGTIDAWINNAGADILTGPGAALSDVQKMDRLLAVDLRGTILASWCAVDVLSTSLTAASSSI